MKRLLAGILVVCFMVCSLNIQKTGYGQTEGENRIEQISLGWNYNGAITSDGSLYMWGSNSNGQLGDGTTTDSLVPKKIDLFSTAEPVELILPENVKDIKTNARDEGHGCIISLGRGSK